MIKVENNILLATLLHREASQCRFLFKAAGTIELVLPEGSFSALLNDEGLINRRLLHCCRWVIEHKESYDFDLLLFQGEDLRFRTVSITPSNATANVSFGPLTEYTGADFFATDSQLLAAIDDVILITEAEPLREPGPRIIYVNEAFTRMTGYKVEDVLGKTPRILQGANTEKTKTADMGEKLIRWERVQETLTNYHADGREFQVELRMSPVKDKTGWWTHWISVQRDVTEDVETRRQLAQQRALAEHNSRLASIGELAAGIGHEINNPLTVVQGFTEMLIQQQEARDPEDKATLASLQKIYAGSERVRVIVDGLRSLAGVNSEELSSLDPVSGLATSIQFLEEIYAKDGVTIHFANHVAAPITVLGNAAKLQQVFINLLSNANYACQRCTDRVIRILATEHPESVHLRFNNGGPAIPSSVAGRIFEPFVSTKPTTDGSGLGLSFVHRLVADMKGDISLEENEEGNVSFLLKLPIEAESRKSAV